METVLKELDSNWIDNRTCLCLVVNAGTCFENKRLFYVSKSNAKRGIRTWY